MWISEDDMVATCYLTCGKIAADFEQLELSVGESTVAAAVAEATGVRRELSALKQQSWCYIAPRANMCCLWHACLRHHFLHVAAS